MAQQREHLHRRRLWRRLRRGCDHAHDRAKAGGVVRAAGPEIPGYHAELACVNAFALPDSQLVTRGLIALANDDSSLLPCWRMRWRT
jgi:hypothetical protein